MKLEYKSKSFLSKGKRKTAYTRESRPKTHRNCGRFISPANYCGNSRKGIRERKIKNPDEITSCRFWMA
jgi:hypothetical protein